MEESSFLKHTEEHKRGILDHSSWNLGRSFASGIINAVKKLGLGEPIIIRLQGTNVKEAKAMIDGCGIKMIIADDLDDAAEKVVGVADILSQASKVKIGVEFETLSK